ncbi:MAG: hypothetical protein M3041_09735 [Acidobacteriota bacterium]|nr:hypothetical protein [Acidobacteriota bacterium]
MWRRIGGVIAGIIVAVLVVEIAELAVHYLYPPPPGYNMRDMNDVKKFVATLPLLAMMLVLIGWAIGTVLGTFVASKIGRSRIPAYVVGGLLLVGGIANAVMIPQPVWFSIVSFIIYIGGTIIGAAASRPPELRPTPPPAGA